MAVMLAAERSSLACTHAWELTAHVIAPLAQNCASSDAIKEKFLYALLLIQNCTEPCTPRTHTLGCRFL